MSGSPVTAFADWLAPVVPARRLALVRIAVVGFACAWMLSNAPDLLGRAQLPVARFDPVGIVRWTGPVAPSIVTAILVLVGVSGAMTIAGVGYRIIAPVFAMGSLWLLSYRNSWGHMSHVEHLMMLHVGILALAPAADALRPGAGTAPSPDRRYGWPLRLMMLVTVSTYAIAGLAKLRIGGLEWLGGESLRLHVAHEQLRMRMIGVGRGGLGAWLLPHAGAFSAMAIGTVVLELGAVVALRSGWIRVVWIGGLWLMHVGIWAVMGIGFPYPLSGVAFLAFFSVERGWERVRGWWSARAGARG